MNNGQNRLNAIAGCMLLLGALIRGINTFDIIKAMRDYSKYGLSLPWQVWFSMIAGVALVALLVASGVFLLQAKDELYAKSAMGIGILTLADYVIIVLTMFKNAGVYGTSILFRWQYIMIYGAMICYGLCFFLSGKYAKDVSEDPENRKPTQWMQGPGAFLTGVIFTFIAAAGFGQSPLDLFSTVPSERWIQIASLLMDFLALTLAGMYLKNVEKDSRTIPVSNNPAAPPFYGAGSNYGAGYPGQNYGAGYPGQNYGAGPGYGAGAPGSGMAGGTPYGQAPLSDYSNGINMPKKPDTSKGNFDELLNYGRQQGYGQNDVDMKSGE